MSIFEVIMLICFGAAWPFSIYKSYTSTSTSGVTQCLRFQNYFAILYL